MNRKPIPAQKTAIVTAVLGFYFPVSLFIVLMIVLSVVTETPFHMITRDINAINQGSFYTGAISQVGLLLWSAAAAVCFLTATLLSKPIERDKRAFFCGAGILTFILLMDDTFMIHEHVWYKYVPLSSKYLFGAYALFLGTWALKFQSILFASDYLLLVLSIFLLGTSLCIDILHDNDNFGLFHIDYELIDHLVEDGPKFLGIAGWLAYWFQTCREHLSQDQH